MLTTIRVQLAGGDVREYPAMIAEFGNYLADGGRVIGLFTAQQQAREFFRANKNELWQALTFWVTLDDSGVAYRVEINRRGTHTVRGAAPMPGPNNVKALYVA
jgi:hypothetical protein